MASDHVVTNIVTALEGRQHPTITTWNRLEGRPRRPDFGRALKAEVRDGLFLLAKQHQLGEYLGDDAGSPATVKVQLFTSRLRTYQAARGAVSAFDDALPVEARVERRPVPLAMDGRPFSLDVRLLMGRQWLRMVKAALPAADYAAAFADRHRIPAPDPHAAADAAVCAHPEAFQVVAAVAGRCMDGGALHQYLTGGAGRHAWDGVSGIDPADRDALDQVAADFLAWFAATFAQPPAQAPGQPAPGEDAWVPGRLEYQFACAVPEGSGETVLEAQELHDRRLDWYALDVDPGRATLGAPGDPAPDPQKDEVRSLLPTPLAYDGMPNTRWWAFEDRRVNFGAVSPATTDLGKMVFLEFGLVYANDWFLVPVTVDAGSLVRVRGLAVTTVFGERFWIDAAGAGADDAWQRWSMFNLSVKGTTPGQRADTGLLLLPTAPKIQLGPPLEQVQLVRDEVANMVWGLEKTITLPSGQPKPGAEAAAETAAYHRRLLDEARAANPPPAPPAPAAPIVYDVMSSVPESWIPFVPVHVPDDVRSTQLQRASMPRLLEGDPAPPERVRPRTTLLRDGLEPAPRRPYYLHEEEVPRAGAVVSQAYRRTRWTNGRVVVWLGATKLTGRGEGASGLAFDRLADAP